MVDEFANGKLDYGNLDAPTAKYLALEHMFYVMRQRAKESIAALRKHLDGRED